MNLEHPQQPQYQPPQQMQQPQTDQQPVLVQPDYPQASAQPHKKSILVPILLMTWPIIALIGMVLLSAIVNYLAGPTDDDIYAKPNALRSIYNILSFLVGAAAILLGLPSFIWGIIKLTKR